MGQQKRDKQTTLKGRREDPRSILFGVNSDKRQQGEECRLQREHQIIIIIIIIIYC